MQLEKQKLHNKGFSFIELLIAMTIFSIVMLMVVEFMSTSSGAYRKTKKNLNVQTEALQVTEQLSDTLMQASYVRISVEEPSLYTIDVDTSQKRNKRVVTKSGNGVDCDFVPDNYGNYVKTGDPFNMDNDAIIDLQTYKLVNKKGMPHPIDTGDRDMDLGGVDARSFRMLNHDNKQYYVQPDYIYMEYRTPSANLNDSTPSKEMQHVIYKIVKEKDARKIYTFRYTADITDNAKGYKYAMDQINGMISSDEDGLLTEVVEDFYVSVDVEGNALLTNILFEDNGYEYNTVETINFRNSNVLTVRPQRLYKVAKESAPTTATTQSNNGGTLNPPNTP